ncbi:MAG: hypothetical protein ACKN9W_19030 [Methylococcus sp.]
MISSVRPALIPCLALALWAAHAAAENTVTIGGSGGSKVNINASGATNGVIDLYQVSSSVPGEENQAGTALNPIVQSGSGHVARIGQGANWNGNVWVPGTAVANNTASIRQTGAGADNALIVQTSSGNSATITQYGAAATASITQGGAGGHTATIETLNTYVGAGVIVNQTGASNRAYITGMSGGGASVDQSGTGGYVNLANQTSGQLNISQQGTNNGITVENYGAGASAGKILSITQTGVGGAETVFNPSPAPDGPGYSTAYPTP